MGAIGKPKREIYIPVPPREDPHPAVEPAPVVAPEPAREPVPTGA
jgi:hypothetical protein